MSERNEETDAAATSTIGGTVDELKFDLPNDVPTLAEMRAAIDKKIADLKTAGAESLRSLMVQESARLGMSPEELLLGASGEKPRRRGRGKREAQ